VKGFLGSTDTVLVQVLECSYYEYCTRVLEQHGRSRGTASAETMHGRRPCLFDNLGEVGKKNQILAILDVPVELEDASKTPHNIRQAMFLVGQSLTFPVL